MGLWLAEGTATVGYGVPVASPLFLKALALVTSYASPSNPAFFFSIFIDIDIVWCAARSVCACVCFFFFHRSMII